MWFECFTFEMRLDDLTPACIAYSFPPLSFSLTLFHRLFSLCPSPAYVCMHSAPCVFHLDLFILERGNKYKVAMWLWKLYTVVLWKKYTFSIITIYCLPSEENRKTSNFKLKVLLKTCTVTMFDAHIIAGAR